MKKVLKTGIVACIVLVLSLAILTGCEKNNEDKNKYKVVTSFYPVYIMTLNITDGANNVEISNMTDTNVGCLHNYTLQTQDLKKVETADLFIQNGLDIENFMDKLVSTFSNLKVVNSTEKIKDVIEDEDEKNGHTWLSINNYIKQVREISENLEKNNEENNTVYQSNTTKYVEQLEKLDKKYKEELEQLKGKKVVSLNESFSYLERDLGLDAIEVHTDHEESTLSAEKLKGIINKMKEENIQIIIIDKDDNEKNAQNLAQETGAKIYKLDSCLTGKRDKDAYLNAMEENLRVLKEMI